ncbi:uncharacterized protein LAESUDRAFT_720577 [Laetiporus sulphureus 93-53]|uniref:TPR-like protein n=1 Tax=Laetiporus sulphureus 93-53 TaxID=1314785 RepID=A0A165H7L9_9APHY|nr:uncharacterized protein LAESUDRAFT_720577 [Laetiporus sulphureus 93-53]KZT11355.1 hypothetical protein LAESUDRAFT_720577 [Laetiporus sulphureus 93-53]
MLARHPHRAALLVLRRFTVRRRHPALCRFESNGNLEPVSPQTGPQNGPSTNFIQNSFIRDTAFALDTFRRLLKFSLIGVVGIGATAVTALMAAHLWVEQVELAPETDEEVRKWEWDREADRWTGGATGGTDPGLGTKGRMAVRSAWIAQNWGTGSAPSVVGSKAYSGRVRSGEGMRAVEARLEFAQDFLNIAIHTASQKSQSGNLRPDTITELIARHANVMERMGTKDALFEARSEYERVWAGLPGKGIDSARIALKLGDLNHRLGDPEDALAWWARSIQLAQGSTVLASVPPAVPASVPSAPLAQRTLISNLVSLSAHYATSGQLRQARAVEEASLALLRSVKQPESFESTTPPHALHALFILHRSSLISIHLAEVLYALKEQPAVSVQWLSRAAESAERVALVLTGLPPIHPDAPESQIPHPPSSEAPLVPAYAKSRTMSRPAGSLLRDSRRTAAEAWNLMGILVEKSRAKGATEKALECYERALGWAGVAADKAGGIGKAGEGTLETEWKALWANYVRVRDVVRKETENGK